MEKVQLYANNNDQQFRDSRTTIEEFLPEMRWNCDREIEIILDVGSGSGNVTRDVLWASLPEEQQSKTLLVGSDISGHMVNFANEKFATLSASKSLPQLEDVVGPKCPNRATPGILYTQLDISKPLHPTCPLGMASKIFSFNCLHWAQDQVVAHTNIFELLNHGGEALLLFTAKHPSRQAYREVAEQERWAPYMTDVARYTTPFEMDEDQAGKMRSLLEKVGFHVNCCEIRRKSFTFASLEIMRRMGKSMTAFQERIENEQERNEFVDQVFHYTCLNNEKTKLNEGSTDMDERTFVYKLFVIHVTKP